MTIRTNNLVSYLEDRVEYNKNALKLYGKVIDGLKKDLEESELNLDEAKNRVAVGEDETGAKAYIADGVLWVEDKPSGWRIEEEDLVTGSIKKVCYDGGTNWVGVITFY